MGDNSETKKSYEEIAKATGGKAAQLRTADDLLDVVCLQALEQVLSLCPCTRLL